MATTFDFNNVSVTEAEMPKSGAGRPRKTENNPFTEVLAQSYEAFKSDKNAGRSIKVPGANVAEAVYLIRQAADDLKVGARILVRNGKGESVQPKDAKDSPRATFTVLFSGKERKQKRATEAPATEDVQEDTEDTE